MFALAGDRGLALCEFVDRPMLPTQLARVGAGPLFGDSAPIAAERGEHPILDQTERELREYFAAERDVFTIPLQLEGTEFQTRVWRELLRIPFGVTRSYGDMAARVGAPGAARAVGRANGDNRIAIVVPCHRVINADGSLSGYGGGRRRKQWLLRHEQRGLQLDLLSSASGLAESTALPLRKCGSDV